MKDQAQILARYQRLREVGRAVNTALGQTLPRDVLDEGGQKLGVLHGRTLSVGSEAELSVVIDFCIHDVRRQGLTAFERFLAQTPYPAGSDEQVYLEALKEARFSLFLAEGREMDVGIHYRDLLSDTSHFVVDRSMSRTAPVDLVMALRLVTLDDFSMTTGLAVPVCVLPGGSDRERVLGEVVSVLGGPLSRAWSAEQRSEATCTLLTALLETGAMSHVVAPEEAGGFSSGRASGQPSVGRYDPCPCGSGKKFKFCCGARRR
jgi:hypothetical protein